MRKEGIPSVTPSVCWLALTLLLFLILFPALLLPALLPGCLHQQHIMKAKFNEKSFAAEFKFMMETSRIANVAKCLGRFDATDDHGNTHHFLVMEGV